MSTLRAADSESALPAKTRRRALCTVLLAISAYSAEYFISPSGNDNHSGTSAQQAWATFARGLNSGTDGNKLQPGDTLVLLDGIYKQTFMPQNVSGTDGAPITIRAEHDGKAEIDGEFAREVISLYGYRNVHHYVFEGIIARNGPPVRGKHVIIIETHNNILRRVSAYDAYTEDNCAPISVSGNNNLLEDCIVAGTGRKMLNVFKSDSNVVRRCLIDWRGWDGRHANQSWPDGVGITYYNCNDVIVENCISYGHTPVYGFGFSANGGMPASRNKNLGCMVVNSGRDFDGDLVFWGPDPNNPPLTQVQPLVRPLPTTDASADHVSGVGTNPAYRSGINLYASGLFEDNFLQDVVVWGCAGNGITMNISGGTVTNCVINRATVMNNALDNNIARNIYNPQPLTITNSRIEGHTSSQGEGARMKHRYVNGELMDGTNGKPAQKLWPWSMEQRVRDELGYSITSAMVAVLDTLGIEHGFTGSSVSGPKPAAGLGRKPIAENSSVTIYDIRGRMVGCQLRKDIGHSGMISGQGRLGRGMFIICSGTQTMKKVIPR